jgi:uncharacterized membrane protein
MNLRGLGSNLASADDSPREATLDNNRVGKVISISEDPIRVLLVDAYPRWNSRFIMNIISRDKRISLTRIFRSISFGNGKTGLLPSTQEELDGYDAVILGDLKPEELAPEDAQRLANFVSRRGGFLVLLSGPRALPGSYMMGKLADVMPVRAVSSTYEEKPDGSPARLRLTTAGAHHPITGIFENPALNEKLWPELPGLYRISRRVFSKPGSEVLLETADEMRTPVVALSRYGAGRVLFMGAEDAWRWRDGIGGRVHQTFWLQALRWGLGMRLSGKDRRLQVSLSRRMLSPGEVAELQARATLSGGVASNGKIIVTIEKLSDAGSPMIGTVRELELSPHQQ